MSVERSFKQADIQLLQGSLELFPALVAAFDAAQQEVRLETYIFDFNHSSIDVADALVRAALRGVAVRLVVDGIGTGQLPVAWQQRFNQAGVQWHVYRPLGRLGLLLPSRWRRLHRKLCVVDGETAQAVAFCGGINLLDDYFDPTHGPLEAPRFDFAVVTHGALAQGIHSAMAQLWYPLQALRSVKKRAYSDALDLYKAAIDEATEPLSPSALFSIKSFFKTNNDDSVEGSDPSASTSAMQQAWMLYRDNVRNRARIEQAYRRAVATAKHEIIIANAYFLPGRKLRRALILAAQRGVRVRLLVQGRYESFMQFHAARPVYGALMDAGIAIYEYAPSFLHAKVAVIDASQDMASPSSIKPWATVGSSNLDPLSLLLAREANLVTEDRQFAFALHKKLVHAIESEGQHLQPERYLQRPRYERLRDWMAFGLMRLALWLTGKRY